MIRPFFTYKDKDANRNTRQNNSTYYDWIHKIGAKRPGKKSITDMIRNGLENRHIKLHIIIPNKIICATLACTNRLPCHA